MEKLEQIREGKFIALMKAIGTGIADAYHDAKIGIINGWNGLKNGVTNAWDVVVGIFA